MALSKSSTAITQLTASGNSTAVSLPTSIAPLVSLHHSNGSGSVTAAGTAQVQYQVNGAARYYSYPSFLVVFSTTTGATDDRAVTLPDGVTSVRIAYTVPTGATSPTLDAEIGSVTP